MMEANIFSVAQFEKERAARIAAEARSWEAERRAERSEEALRILRAKVARLSTRLDGERVARKAAVVAANIRAVELWAAKTRARAAEEKLMEAALEGEARRVAKEAATAEASNARTDAAADVHKVEARAADCPVPARNRNGYGGLRSARVLSSPQAGRGGIVPERSISGPVDAVKKSVDMALLAAKPEVSKTVDWNGREDNEPDDIGATLFSAGLRKETGDGGEHNGFSTGEKVGDGIEEPPRKRVNSRCPEQLAAAALLYRSGPAAASPHLVKDDRAVQLDCPRRLAMDSLDDPDAAEEGGRKARKPQSADVEEDAGRAAVRPGEEARPPGGAEAAVTARDVKRRGERLRKRKSAGADSAAVVPDFFAAYGLPRRSDRRYPPGATDGASYEVSTVMQSMPPAMIIRENFESKEEERKSAKAGRAEKRIRTDAEDMEVAAAIAEDNRDEKERGEAPKERMSAGAEEAFARGRPTEALQGAPPEENRQQEERTESTGAEPAREGGLGAAGRRRRNLVDHTYHDYSGAPDDVPDEDPGRKKYCGGVKVPFPEKLMEILCRVDFTSIVKWLPHGRAFIFFKNQTFVSEVLSRYFSSSNLQTFTRQLKYWGFKRITKGQDAGAYYHELFLRGKPRLCHRMKRCQKSNGPVTRLNWNPDGEPDFYRISAHRPLPPFRYRTDLPPLPEKNTVASRRGRKPSGKARARAPGGAARALSRVSTAGGGVEQGGENSGQQQQPSPQAQGYPGFPQAQGYPGFPPPQGG